jgi:hypothetical protein
MLTFVRTRCHCRSTRVHPGPSRAPLAFALFAIGAITSPVAGQVTVFLDYGTAGNPDDDFNARLNELTAMTGYAPPSVAEVAGLKAAIKSGLQAAFAPLNVSFVENLPVSGDFKRLEFGQLQQLGTENVPIGSGDWENDGWLNIDPTGTGHVYPVNFANFQSYFPPLSRTQALQLLTGAMTLTAVHEVGHGFGLNHHDAYGNPAIQPATYSNTGGVQYIDPMSFGNGTGFDVTTALSINHRFSQLSMAKLEFDRGLTASPPPLTSETGGPHSSAALAQALTLTSLPISGVKAADVHLASINQLSEKDVYKLPLTAGSLLTAQTRPHDEHGSYDPVNNPEPFDLYLKLLAPNGSTIVAQDDDIVFGPSFGPYGNFAENADALLLNIPITASGTYYLEVSDKGTDVGNYDLFLSVSLPGDYNRNGVVDAADYTVWRDSRGSTTNFAADGNGNGVIDSGDLSIWTLNFGHTVSGSGASASAAVPEPACLLLLFTGMLMMIMRHLWTGQK